MSDWKMPPKAKIYEALSAVADRRVCLTGPTTARVRSSSGDRVYDVAWSEDQREFTSNDNASTWQGYLGYPIIAVLFTIGTLPFDAGVAERLGGTPWKELNDRFKRDYDRAIEHVLDRIEAGGGDRAKIVQEAERIYETLGTLGLQRGKRRRPPPKGTGP